MSNVGFRPVTATFAITALLVTTSPLAWSQAPATQSGGPAPAMTQTRLAALPETVTGDVLPTPQINGVVRAQVVIGNTVYVGGDFTAARPFGVPAGQQEVPRDNFLAYDLHTGALRNDVDIPFSGDIRSLAVSPDKQTLYVGGNFTSVNELATADSPWRLAAINVANHTLVSSFKPKVDWMVEAIATHASGVYFGGAFSSVNGQPRTRLAAVQAGTGTLLPWAPTSDERVLGMAISPDGSKVVLGGKFSALNGQPRRGWGAVNLGGALARWDGHPKITNSGANSAIYSVRGTADGVYVTGMSFGVAGEHPFEGSAFARWDTGAVEVVNSAAGDTYDTAVLNGVLYTASHMHDGSPLGEFPETVPRRHSFANAFTAKSVDGYLNPEGHFGGVPRPSLLPWWPDFGPGGFTESRQAAWNVVAAQDYVLYGGEFVRVNGVAQQGLTRFTTRAKAPKKTAPRPASSQQLTVSVDKSHVLVKAPSLYDVEDGRLTHELLRGTTVVDSLSTADTWWWNRVDLNMIDRFAPLGTHTYTIRTRDLDGNVTVSPAATATVTQQSPPDAPLPAFPKRRHVTTGKPLPNVTPAPGKPARSQWFLRR